MFSDDFRISAVLTNMTRSPERGGVVVGDSYSASWSWNGGKLLSADEFRLQIYYFS